MISLRLSSPGSVSAPTTLPMPADVVPKSSLGFGVGSLRVEIAGPLGTDSLSKLLELVK